MTGSTRDSPIFLDQARNDLEECRAARQNFEAAMDINSCEDHRQLALLYEKEKKLGLDLELAEQELLEERKRFRIRALALLSVIAGISMCYVAYVLLDV